MPPPYSPKGATLAVAGVGRMGMRHAEAARNLGMIIIGLADFSGEALAAARREFGVPDYACFSDAGAMLEKTRPTAAVIATTAPGHAPLVLKAAAAGVRYILCEKPMASSLDEADAMINACASSGSVLGINHQMRFMPQYTHVRALLGSEKLGPLVSIVVAGSNFGLAMNASHYFEMFRYMTGQPIATVQAWLEEDRLANPRGAQFEDRSGRLMASSAEGVSLYIDMSAEAGWGLQVIYICRHGQIFVDELSGEMRVAAREAEYRNLPTSRYGMPAEIETLKIEPADTVAPTMAVWNAMFSGHDFPDGATGAHVLSSLVAAHLSHRRSGRPVFTDGPKLPRSEIFDWA